MLYITTRNKIDSYTAYRVLHECIAPDGGLFLPIKFPVYTQEQITALKEKGFCQIVSDVLNVFFSAGLTGWDVESAIGRKPVSFLNIGRKLTVAELWKNTEHSYSACANRIYAILCGDKTVSKQVFGWPSLAIRIAFLFGVYGAVSCDEAVSVDAAAADFETVISLWYARSMGLPVGKIICGCNENCGVWDLLYKGQIDTGAAVVSTDAPNMDWAAPGELEYLIYSTLGLRENLRYLDTTDHRGTYQISSVEIPALNADMFSSVVGQSRVRDIIKSIHSTNHYLIDPYTAIAYGALQDYRAKSGESRMTVLLTQERPACYSALISQVTGLTDEQISKY